MGLKWNKFLYYLFLIILFTGFSYAEVLVINPGFEEGSKGWKAYVNSFKIDDNISHSGSKSLCLSSDIEIKYKEMPYGASQTVEVGQRQSGAFTVGIWGKTKDLVFLREDRVGDKGSWARLRLFINFQDGSMVCNPKGQNNPIFNFTEEDTEWTYKERTFVYDKPVKSITFVFMMNNCTGAVWFDDLYFEVSGAYIEKGKDVDIVKFQESETGGIVENSYIKVVIDKLHGGRITSFIYKPFGKEFTCDIPNGGIMKDMIMEAGFGEYFDVYYNMEVISNTEEKVSVCLTGYTNKLPFIRINKTYTVFSDSSVLRVDYKITNLPESMASNIITFRNHNYLKVAGEKNRYFIPTSTGITETEENSVLDIWYKDLVRGWAGFIGQESKVGMVYEVDYQYIDYFYNWFGNEVTLEAFYKPIKIEAGESLNTTVLMKPFSGLEKISDSKDNVIICFEGLDKKFSKSDDINFSLKIVSTTSMSGSAELTYRVLPEGSSISIDKKKFDIKTGQVLDLPFSFRPVSEGTAVISAKIVGETGEIVTAVVPIIIGQKTVTFKYEPIEEKSKMVSEYSGLKPQYLSMEYKTPHIKWASPLEGGKIKVLAITNGYNGREIVELAQRLDMDFDVVLFGGGFTTAKYYLNFSDDDSNRWLSELLKREYDAILIGGIGWSSFSKVNQESIYKKVSEGIGLVYISPSGLDKEIQPLIPLEGSSGVKTSKWIKNKSHYITDGIPLDVLPSAFLYGYTATGEVLIGSENSPLLTIKENKGRVVAFSYVTGYGLQTPPSPWSGITPTPLNGGPLEENLTYPYWEYYHMLLARSIIWVAKRDGISISISREKSVVILSVESKKEEKVKLVWERRDNFYRIIGNGDIAIDIKEGKNNINIPLLETTSCSNLEFLHIWVISQEGLIKGFAGISLNNELPVEIKKIEGKFTSNQCPIILEGSVTFKKSTPAECMLNIELKDTYNRIVASNQESVPEGTQTFSFNLTFEDPLTKSYTLSVRPVYNGIEMQEEVLKDIFLQTGKRDSFDDYRMTLWILEAQFFHTPEYIRQYQFERLRPFDIMQVFNSGWETIVKSYTSEELYKFITRQGFELALNDLCPSHLGADVFDKLRKGYSETKDKKYLERPQCLHDPEYRKSAQERVNKLVTSILYFEPAYYCFGDEASLTQWGQPFDFCFSAYTLKEFRKWLEEKYIDINTLNKIYGSNYKSFDEVVPFTTEEAMVTKNYSSWLDHRRFMDLSNAEFYVWLKNDVKNIDPNGKISTSGTPTVHNPYSGYDWEMLMKKVYNGEILFPYGGLQREFQRSFATKETRILPHHGYSTTGKPVYYRVWNDAFYYRGAGFNYFCQSVVLNEDFTLSRQFSDLLDASKELREGIAKILMDSDNIYDGVAILYSQDSMRMASILGKNDMFVSNLTGWTLLLHEVGLKYKFVGENDIKGLLKSGFNTLILPYNLILDSQEIKDIKEFVTAGGILIADIDAGDYNRYGKENEIDVAGQLFGIKRGRGQVVPGEIVPLADWLTEDKFRVILQDSEIHTIGGQPQGKVETSNAIFINNIGKGKSVYLNFAMDRYPVVIKAPNVNSQYINFINQITKHLGIRKTTVKDILDNNGKNAQGIQTFVYCLGNGLYVGLSRRLDHLVENEGITINLDNKYNVYDVRNKNYIGFTDTIKTVLPAGDSSFFALLPYKIENIEGFVVEDKVNKGQDVKYKFNLKATDSTIGPHIVRIEVYNPSGKFIDCYSMNMKIENGVGQGYFRTAFNDQTGEWNIKIIDVSTGISKVIKFQLI